MKEAEATVDLEERERNHTETLKLVFVLYFTVLKREVGKRGVGVLESTLRGLSMYAHRVNVDFFPRSAGGVEAARCDQRRAVGGFNSGTTIDKDDADEALRTWTTWKKTTCSSIRRRSPPPSAT